MAPRRPPEAFGFDEPAPEELAPLGAEGQAQSDLVNELLGSLHRRPLPVPPKITGLQRTLGVIGDALQAYGTGLMRQPPPNTFANRMRARQAEYNERLAAAEEENRQLENNARIMAFRESMMRGRPKPDRPFRPQLKVMNTVDEAGRPVDVPFLFDPNAQTLSPMTGHEEGFRKWVAPKLAQGIDPDTGELVYKLIDPLMGLGGGQPQAGVAPGAAPTAPDIRTVPGLEPKPTATESEAAEAATVIQDQITRFGDLATKYADRKRIMDSARSAGQNLVRALPGGKVATEMLGDPAFEELAALRDRIGQQLARLVENGRLSDQDREFALTNLPTIPALTTNEGRKTAAAKIALVQREIALRIARKRRLRPGLMGGAGAAESPADALMRQYEEEYRAKPPSP